MTLGFEKLNNVLHERFSEHITHKPTTSEFMGKGRLKCVRMIYTHKGEVVSCRGGGGGNKFFNKEKENH